MAGQPSAAAGVPEPASETRQRHRQADQQAANACGNHAALQRHDAASTIPRNAKLHVPRWPRLAGFASIVCLGHHSLAGVNNSIMAGPDWHRPAMAARALTSPPVSYRTARERRYARRFSRRPAIRSFSMTRRCELTGKLPMSGQLRSHAENKTKRTFRPNLCRGDADQRRAAAQGAAAHQRPCPEDGRAPRRPRRLPDEGERRGAFRALPEAQARSQEGAERAGRRRRRGSAVGVSVQHVTRWAAHAPTASRSMRTSVRSAPQTNPVFVSVILKPARS